jgi:nitrogenase molybdenum-iron protein alpha/beta subunit
MLGTLMALLLLGSLLAARPGSAGAASLSSSRAKSAVVKYVKHRWGTDYAVHPACYSVGSRKSKCLVHMVHGSNSCTKYATVTLRGRRARVSMSKPSC